MWNSLSTDRPVAGAHHRVAGDGGRVADRSLDSKSSGTPSLSGRSALANVVAGADSRPSRCCPWWSACAGSASRGAGCGSRSGSTCRRETRTPLEPKLTSVPPVTALPVGRPMPIGAAPPPRVGSLRGCRWAARSSRVPRAWRAGRASSRTPGSGPAANLPADQGRVRVPRPSVRRPGRWRWCPRIGGLRGRSARCAPSWCKCCQCLTCVASPSMGGVGKLYAVD